MNRVRQWVFVTLLVLGVAPLARADELGFGGAVMFRTTLSADSTLSIPLTGWTPQHRAFVERYLADMRARAPGLLARATQAGPIHIYRTTEPTPSHPAAAWIRRRHENSLVLQDAFFREGFPNAHGVDYSHWLFVHEIAHLADPVDQLGHASEWVAAMQPILDGVERDLAAQDQTVRDAMFAYNDAPAHAHGLPSVYAATNLHEAVAELTAAMYFRVADPRSAAAQRVLSERMFAPPPAQDAQIVNRYRAAYYLYRQGSLDAANEQLDAALRINPDFTMGYYLRGYVNFQREDMRAAYVDWQRSLSFFEGVDPTLTSEIKAALAQIQGGLGK